MSLTIPPPDARTTPFPPSLVSQRASTYLPTKIIRRRDSYNHRLEPGSWAPSPALVQPATDEALAYRSAVDSFTYTISDMGGTRTASPWLFRAAGTGWYRSRTTTWLTMSWPIDHRCRCKANDRARRDGEPLTISGWSQGSPRRRRHLHCVRLCLQDHDLRYRRGTAFDLHHQRRRRVQLRPLSVCPWALSKPIARDDRLTAISSRPATVKVLSNDEAPDHEDLTITHGPRGRQARHLRQVRLHLPLHQPGFHLRHLRSHHRQRRRFQHRHRSRSPHPRPSPRPTLTG